MTSPSTDNVLDHDYRKMVSDAAGVDYLAGMTGDCLKSVEDLLADRPALGEDLRARAHRLAGGTATVGLPALAAALKALENTAKSATDADPTNLYARCEARLREAYAAVAEEASTRSSR